MSNTRRSIARAIACAFLSAWPDREVMVEHAALAVGARWQFLDVLAARALESLSIGPPLPPIAKLTRFVALDPGLLAVWSRGAADEGDEASHVSALHPNDFEALKLGARLEVRSIYLIARKMRPVRPWPVPSIATEIDLLGFLSLAPSELHQLASVGRRERVAPLGPLRNYAYKWRRKRGGGFRLIEAPKTHLKNIQRKISRAILAQVPIDEAVHGFRREHSIVTHAARHVGRAVVLKMDLAEFFPSISGARITALFHAIGYPERVARLLAALTTNTVPRDVFRGDPSRELDPWLRALLSSRHLPPGAPSSPAIANLCAFRLDRRLSGLAEVLGATYSRYADDLVFSGDGRFARGLARFIARVSEIAIDEGFRVNARKTRVMRAGVRQKVTGLVVNTRPNLPRTEYEALKATLHNAVRFGPRSQMREQGIDFRAFLRGKIAYVAMVHPARGKKLFAVFERIDWTEMSR